jgi:hypothetical protein
MTKAIDERYCRHRSSAAGRTIYPQHGIVLVDG